MKYHYKIVSSWDPTDVHTDSRNWDSDSGDFKGFSSYEEANNHGEKEIKRYGLNPDQYYVNITPDPEDIVEQDMLDGHHYPGHEMFD